MATIPFPSAYTPAQAMLSCMQERDASLFCHGGRVGQYALMIGNVLGLPEDTLATLEMAARLHDIGKLFVPTYLLQKPNAFAPQEYRIIQNHTLLGGRILDGDPSTPELTQITAVADAFDDMTSHRVFRSCGSHKAGIGEILRCSGTQFSPVVVDAFLEVDSREWIRFAS